ncbi:PREDICTED: uncharacterized protein LOC105315988, partial [Amphimedon queenslandica]
MLVTAFEANSDVPNLETVIEKLQHEERKQTKRKAVNETEEGLTAKHKARRGPKCHYCKRFGHIQRFCKEREKAQSGTRSSTGVKKSHSTCATFHKANSATTKKPAGDTDSDEAGLVVEHALPAQQTLKSQDKWIVDSGATSHTCNDKACFTHLYPLEIPLEVKLGDGRSLRAVAQGSVQLTMKNGHEKYHKCKLYGVLYVPDLS